MENNIPTAEEFIKKELYIVHNDNYQVVEVGDIIEEKERLAEKFIEFAKLHVESALKEQKSKLNDLVKYGAINETWEEVQKSINNAYPLTLIK
jgi:UTP-glucose-1-phosphate uridylyltransferase